MAVVPPMNFATISAVAKSLSRLVEIAGCDGRNVCDGLLYEKEW